MLSRMRPHNSSAARPKVEYHTGRAVRLLAYCASSPVVRNRTGHERRSRETRTKWFPARCIGKTGTFWEARVKIPHWVGHSVYGLTSITCIMPLSSCFATWCQVQECGTSMMRRTSAPRHLLGMIHNYTSPNRLSTIVVECLKRGTVASAREVLLKCFERIDVKPIGKHGRRSRPQR